MGSNFMFTRPFLMVLALPGHGTARLAHGLAQLGLEGGHSVIGSANVGSVTPVASIMRTHLENPREGFLDSISDCGDCATGDGKLAALWGMYMQSILNAVPSALCDELMRQRVLQAVQPFLGKPLTSLFFDISHRISPYYQFFMKHCQDVRVVHLVRDPRQWVQYVVWSRFFEPCGEVYGSIDKPSRKLFQCAEAWADCDPFKKACLYWTAMHRYFLSFGVTVVRTSDFNSTAAQAISSVYRLPADVKLNLHSPSFSANGTRLGSAPRSKPDKEHTAFPNYDEWTKQQKDFLFDSCGSTMREVGFIARGKNWSWVTV